MTELEKLKERAERLKGTKGLGVGKPFYEIIDSWQEITPEGQEALISYMNSFLDKFETSV